MLNRQFLGKNTEKFIKNLKITKLNLYLKVVNSTIKKKIKIILNKKNQNFQYQLKRPMNL